MSDEGTKKINEDASQLAKDSQKKSNKIQKAAKESLKESTKMAEKEVENASDKVKDFSESCSETAMRELKDPAVSTTVLFTAVTASAASTYLTQQHKQGKLSALVAAGVVVGVAALSIAEYFSVKAYFKKNGSS